MVDSSVDPAVDTDLAGDDKKPLLGSGKGGIARKEAMRLLDKELPGREGSWGKRAHKIVGSSFVNRKSSELVNLHG